jgi:cyclic lactone autoinducer peptide
MFKNIKKYLLSGAACMIAMVAAVGVSPLSLFLLYEPDAPKCLKKDL